MTSPDLTALLDRILRDRPPMPAPRPIPRLLLVTHPDGSQMVCGVVEWLSANRSELRLSEWHDLKAELLSHFRHPLTDPTPTFDGHRIQLCSARHFCGAILSTVNAAPPAMAPMEDPGALPTPMGGAASIQERAA